jgi:hypothetical protein
MMAGRFDISAFCDDPQLIARLVRAEDVFGLLTRELALPAQCAALVWGTSGGTTCVHEGGAITAEDAREILFVRTTSFPLQFEIDSLRSSDGFACSAHIELSVSVIPERSELVTFAKKVVGSDSTVRVARISAMCEQAVRVAATAVASRFVADELTGVGAVALGEEISRVLTPVGFECGLTFSKDARASFASHDHAETRRIAASADLERRRLDAQGALRRAEAEAREKHLASLAGALDKVRAMATQAGGLLVADLIRTFDAAQRGELYGALMAMDAPVALTSRIVVTADSEILVFETGRPSEIAARGSPGDELGPLRSVRVSRRDGENVLLAGARMGVHLIGPGLQPIAKYSLATDKPLKHGVNAAVIAGDSIYATHSEVGLIRWSLATPDDAEFVLPEITAHARSVRDIQLDGRGRLWLAVGETVIALQPGALSPEVKLNAGAEVSVLLVADGFAHAGLSNGRIVRWPMDGGDAEEIRAARGRAVESLEWLPGGGVPRLLVADRQSHLDLLVAGDSYRGEYRAALAVRWGLAADDCIVGVSEARDRLYMWSRGAPSEPAAVINVGRLCGQLIQDVAILPEA